MSKSCSTHRDFEHDHKLQLECIEQPEF